jgi:beta-lactamase superfamily II metal-dependent hydrolase
MLLLSRPNPFFGAPLPFAALWRRAAAIVPARVLVPALVLPVVVGGAMFLRPASAVDQIRFLAVAGGDAALVQLADGTNLYLQGDAPATAAARAADPSLPFWNRSIELATLSAADDQSLTDFGDLAGRLSFHRLIRPASGYSVIAEERWQTLATRSNVVVIPVDVSGDGPGPTVAIGKRATLTVYALAGAPKQGRAAALEASLALYLSVGPATVLWVSALPADQARLAASGVPLSARVLKLVGPTTRWGLDPTFFQQVNPSIVVLSSGVSSRFAKPTTATLDLLADRQVYRTDQDGEVDISVEPHGLVIHKGGP